MWIDWTGVIIPALGILATFFVSYYMWILSTNHQRKNIAIALKNEILKLVDRISPLTDREIIQQADSGDGADSQFVLPFFEREDLYYRTVRTEISTFDPRLAELIHDFYKKLGEAEEFRKMLIGKQGEKCDDKLFDRFFSLGVFTQQIIPLLDVEIRWNVLVPHGNKPRSQSGQTIVSLGKVLAGFCIVLLILIGVSTFISGSNDSSRTDSGGTQYSGDYNTYSSNGASYTYPTYAPLTTITPNPEVKLSLGQTATFSGMQVTVHSAQRIESYTYETSSEETGIIKAKNGYVLILIDIEGKNNGLDRAGFSMGQFRLRDSEANNYYPNWDSGKDSIHPYNELFPDEHKRGKAYFEIPSTAKDLKIYWEYSDGIRRSASWMIPN